MVVSKNSMWLIGCGMSMGVLGILMSATWPFMFHAQIKNAPQFISFKDGKLGVNFGGYHAGMMILKNGSTSFDIWKDIPIPIYLECFLFNVTNIEDILMGNNVSLKVQQMGPYVFKERSTKVNITWNDNSTVTFRNQRFWNFRPEMSNGSLSDNITSINPIIATVAYTVRNEPIMTRLFLDMMIRMYHSNLFVTANVSSWLFDGIKDPMLDFIEKIPGLPYTIPFDRFGWFYGRNGSTEATGLFVANTGAEDFHKLGQMDKWNNSNRTVYRDKCGEVKGTTGELWTLEKNTPEINIFASDLCTHMSLAYSGEVVKQGIRGVEFVANDSLFDNGHKYPEMMCYCDEPRSRDCMPAGLLNVSACKYGAPAFVSRPHFLGMDPYYPSKIEGLEPTPNHNFRISIEPVTGMPLAISAQLQANALVRHVPGVSINNQLPDPDTMVPMFWFREDIEVNEEYANFAKGALAVRQAMPLGLYAFSALGLSLLLYGLYKIRRLAMRKLRESDISASQKFLGTNSPTVVNST